MSAVGIDLAHECKLLYPTETLKSGVADNTFEWVGNMDANTSDRSVRYRTSADQEVGLENAASRGVRNGFKGMQGIRGRSKAASESEKAVNESLENVVIVSEDGSPEGLFRWFILDQHRCFPDARTTAAKPVKESEFQSSPKAVEVNHSPIVVERGHFNLAVGILVTEFVVEVWEEVRCPAQGGTLGSAIGHRLAGAEIDYEGVKISTHDLIEKLCGSNTSIGLLGDRVD